MYIHIYIYIHTYVCTCIYTYITTEAEAVKTFDALMSNKNDEKNSLEQRLLDMSEEHLGRASKYVCCRRHRCFVP